jgi:hypothetical protein
MLAVWTFPKAAIQGTKKRRPGWSGLFLGGFGGSGSSFAMSYKHFDMN